MPTGLSAHLGLTNVFNLHCFLLEPFLPPVVANILKRKGQEAFMLPENGSVASGCTRLHTEAEEDVFQCCLRPTLVLIHMDLYP